MSIAGLGTFQSKTTYYAMFGGGKGKDVSTHDSFEGKLSQDDYEIGNDKNMITEVSGESELSKDIDATCIPIMSKGYGDPAAYTRCITANIKTKEAYAQQNSDGEVIYSYKETEQSFNIIINSDGKDKTYTISSIDENGEEFKRAFNPYNVDPKDMDYPEFAAMCMYIRQTDETADLIASSYFTDTSYFDGIFDRGDRVSLLGQYAEEYGDSEPSLASLANKIFNAINTFFDRAMRGSGFSDEAFSLLFADLDDIETQEKISALKNGYIEFGNTTDSVSETIVTKHNQYTDPDTGAIVPVNIKYITAYTDQGISCKEISDVGGKISQRDLWNLSYDSPDSYEKVQGFLKSFPKDQNLTFAPQEKFWKDFMKDDFDIDRFRAFYDSTDNGKIDVEKALQEGKKLGDILTEPYAEYINNTHFIGKVFTEQKMWDNWYAAIEANQQATRANGAGIEPPTETIISADRKAGAADEVGEPYGRSRVEMLVEQYGEDSQYSKALRTLEQSFDATFSNIPDYIKDDWIEMCIDSGVNQITGISLDGKESHLSQIMIQKCVNDYNMSRGNYQYVDFGWGQSVESLVRILNKGILDIDYPLPGQPEHSDSVKKLIANERSFYMRFLEKMGWYI